MPLYRLTTIFQMVSTPTPASPSPARAGGWSESIWTNQLIDAWTENFLELQKKRAAFLPVSAQVVGQRTQLYTIAGNKLLPGGAASSKFTLKSAAGWETDVPQMALQFSIRNAANPNSTTYTARCFPDQFVVGGEYAPSAPITNALNQFMTWLCSPSFGWIGRDLSAPPMKVQGYANGVVTVNLADPALVEGESYVRFYRCKMSTGRSISGSFLVTDIAGNVLTLQGAPTGTIVKPNGLCRHDLLHYMSNNVADIVGVSVRKVGAPFRKYRGRRSASQG